MLKVITNDGISYSGSNLMNVRPIIKELQERGARYCDIREETARESSIQLKNGETEKAVAGTDSGLMVRVLYGNGWGAASVSDVDRLEEASESALTLARKNDEVRKKETGVSKQDPVTDKSEIDMHKNPFDIGFEEKIDYLRELEKSLDRDLVRSTELGYSDVLMKKEIHTSEGTEVSIKIPRVLVKMEITGKKDSPQTVSERIGGTGGYEIAEKAHKKVDGLVEKLRTLLEASAPPSGRMPLIMDPELTGVFVHEAFGHAAEGDLIVSGNSCLEGKLDENVASENVTIVDDPTIDGYGRFPYDDEGTKSRRRILVENGILKDYILDKESAWKLDMEPNGGARAESYGVKPLVRMSNTVMMGGDMELDELIEKVDKGIYAKSSRGGQVDPTQGTFQFNAESAELIEEGERKGSLRDVSFNGFTLETLKNIVGMTEEVDYSGVGSCGKGGQLVPVGSGGPNTLVSEVTVGGRG